MAAAEARAAAAGRLPSSASGRQVFLSWLAQNGGQPPKTYTTMLKMAAAAGPPPAPLAPPASLPPVGAALLADSRFDVPTLAQLGYDPAEAQAVIAGGETEGLRRLDAYLADAKRTATFEKPKTNPTHLQPSTTALSPHLTAGAVSARTFYHRVAAVVRQYKGSKSSPPVSLEGQILWREHWLLIASNTPGKHPNPATLSTHFGRANLFRSENKQLKPSACWDHRRSVRRDADQPHLPPDRLGQQPCLPGGVEERSDGLSVD